MSKIENYVYLGSWGIAKNVNLLQQLGIKRVLTIETRNLPVHNFKKIEYKQLLVRDNEFTDLVSHFPTCCEYIRDSQNNEKGILVHCNLGMSRSPTIVASFLMSKHKWTSQKALEFIKQKKPDIDPNENFILQLNLFAEMNYTVDVNNRHYRDLVTLCLIKTVQMESELMTEGEDSKFHTKKVALEQYFKKLQNTQFMKAISCLKCGEKILDSINQILVCDTCSGVFVEPLPWMLQQGIDQKDSGNLNCPKCRQNIGQFDWNITKIFDISCADKGHADKNLNQNTYDLQAFKLNKTLLKFQQMF